MVDWNPAPLFKEAEAANLDRASQFALAAAAQAIAASGLSASERTGLYWGSGLGGVFFRGGQFRFQTLVACR